MCACVYVSISLPVCHLQQSISKGLNLISSCALTYVDRCGWEGVGKPASVHGLGR